MIFHESAVGDTLIVLEGSLPLESNFAGEIDDKQSLTLVELRLLGQVTVECIDIINDVIIIKPGSLNDNI